MRVTLHRCTPAVWFTSDIQARMPCSACLMAISQMLAALTQISSASMSSFWVDAASRPDPAGLPHEVALVRAERVIRVTPLRTANIRP